MFIKQLILNFIISLPTVRSYAVKILSQTSDETLVLYLLQLVQALKYENFDKIKEGERIVGKNLLFFFVKRKRLKLEICVVAVVVG